EVYREALGSPAQRRLLVLPPEGLEEPPASRGWRDDPITDTGEAPRRERDVPHGRQVIESVEPGPSPGEVPAEPGFEDTLLFVLGPEAEGGPRRVAENMRRQARPMHDQPAT